VPVIGTDVGGIPDTVPEGAGLLVPVDQAAERLAEALGGILRAPERYATMRRQAAAASSTVSWARTADEFKALLHT
jgi:glycosyltransferase involved in cell wall biosynthesis